MIHMFRVKDQGSRGCLLMDGSTWTLCMSASFLPSLRWDIADASPVVAALILTVRATHNSGLVQDYSALTLTDARSAAKAVLALSWLAFSLGTSFIYLSSAS